MNKKSKIHYAWVILIASCFFQAGGLGIFGNTVGIFFAPVCADLGFSRGNFVMNATFAGLASLVGLLFAGKVLPKYNIRLTLTISVTAIAVCFGAMSQFTQLYQWYIASAILGFFSAFVFLTPVPIMISNWFQKKTGFALGLAMAFSGVGGAIFGPIGTSIIISSGWRTGYLSLAGFALLLTLPFTLFVFKFKPADMGLLPYGADEIPAGSTSAAVTTGVTSKEAFKSSAFYFVFVAAFLIAFGMTFYQHFPAYAISLGFSAKAGASLLSLVMIGNIVGKLSLGALADKIGIVRALIVGFCTVAISFVVMFFGYTNFTILTIAAFLYGLSLSLTAIGPPLIVRSIFGTKDYSSIFSTTTMGTQFLSAFGVSIIGYAFDAFHGYQQVILAGIVLYILLCFLLPVCFSAGKKMLDKVNSNQNLTA